MVSKFYSLDLDQIAAEVNLYKYRNPHKEVDFRAVLEALIDEYPDLVGDSATPGQLSAYYKSNHTKDLDELWAVKEIIDVKVYGPKQKRNLKVLVDWKGFPSSDARDDNNWIDYEAIHERFFSRFFGTKYNVDKFVSVFEMLGTAEQSNLWAYIHSCKNIQRLIDTKSRVILALASKDKKGSESLVEPTVKSSHKKAEGVALAVPTEMLSLATKKPIITSSQGSLLNAKIEKATAILNTKQYRITFKEMDDGQRLISLICGRQECLLTVSEVANTPIIAEKCLEFFLTKAKKSSRFNHDPSNV